ncbi:FAA hydrolase family protein [Paracoccus versutus]|uniref:2-keto-4-pentenoate hydratase/2-oxohepta-3-ene-1,7-dioic acid hydratase in catechol pathway n=1 Tax=Paracoccus versutus TaxID=34007 RepID=A0AAQ0HI09_PARVE|nr:fumarylacetoacetate hydrolase family protein [Paracoccus versutus]KGJ12006.1 fumarylacetoacetate hydrolase [Paracoccus versutus]REG46433.1 2-keto-4-pentenoate hydratase/2-oxohepta-3-ene-1,7-dioic acid hydratase in catechol pathway [Paracoccus versutus]WEJ78532.1 FAA hydrolase family protein [Paracoccus versutus]
MKLVGFDGGRIGVALEDGIVDITALSGVPAGSWPPVGMVRLIADFDGLRQAIAEAVAGGPRLDPAQLRLEAPVQWPNKLIAYPANYQAHIEEQITSKVGLISTFKASGQGFFLKANSSLSGPSDPIVLPALPDRDIHHECELAVVIGKGGRGIPRERAMEHVFGFSCLLDMVVRGREERVMRKSFDSFCPLGPHIVTADEIADPAAISLELRVNGELRQQASTRDLIVDIPEMIAMASSVMTLCPGDIIASGTPAGVGPVVGGDVVTISISGVGEMSLPVVQGAAGAHSVWDKQEALSA